MRGFYNRHYTQAEKDLLQASPSIGLEDEIELVTVLIARLFGETANESEELEMLVKAINTLTRSIVRLSQLKLANQKLKKQEESADVYEQAYQKLLSKVQAGIEEPDL
jgi:hypothetical protein